MVTTIEADIKNGMVIGPNAAKLPAVAHVRITLLTKPEKNHPDWDVIKEQFGKLQTRVDTVEWQRQIRSEWD
ncbi:MAG: hypothetical protein PF904_17155 [Kiritimatiellae bacterium]|jgi:hypothetical protein|nr:hypothetical protein [Kiritimatiellia bacterium]